MELIELGRLDDEQYAELVAGEDDPWNAAEFGLVWLPKDQHVALRDEGRLVAAAGLVVVDAQFGTEPTIPVVGLGEVIVTASHRGRGLGRRVIAEALRRAEAKGPEIAMLFCRAELAGLYRRHGFAEIPGPVFVEQPGAGVEISALGAVMWRPLKAGARIPDGNVKIHGLPF